LPEFASSSRPHGHPRFLPQRFVLPPSSNVQLSFDRRSFPQFCPRVSVLDTICESVTLGVSLSQKEKEVPQEEEVMSIRFDVSPRQNPCWKNFVFDSVCPLYLESGALFFLLRMKAFFLFFPLFFFRVWTPRDPFPWKFVSLLLDNFPI